jgi:hypothetical protein
MNNNLNRGSRFFAQVFSNKRKPQVFIFIFLLSLCLLSYPLKADNGFSLRTDKGDSLLYPPSMNEFLADTLLTLYKNSGRKTITAQAGDPLLVRYGSNMLKGELVAVGSDTLVLSVMDILHHIPLADIRSIRFYNSGLVRGLGYPLVVIGAGSMVFGGISLVAGTIAAVQGNIGAIVLVAVPPLGGAGIGLFVLGNRMIGRKATISERKYRFDTSISFAPVMN